MELDRGQTYTAVSKMLQVTIPTLSTWATTMLALGASQTYDIQPLLLEITERARGSAPNVTFLSLPRLTDNIAARTAT